MAPTSTKELEGMIQHLEKKFEENIDAIRGLANKNKQQDALIVKLREDLDNALLALGQLQRSMNAVPRPQAASINRY